LTVYKRPLNHKGEKMRIKLSEKGKEYRDAIVDLMEESYASETDDLLESSENAALMLKEVPGILISVAVSIIATALKMGVLKTSTASKFAEKAFEVLLKTVEDYKGSSSKSLSLKGSSGKDFEDLEDLEVQKIMDAGKKIKH